MGKSGISGFDPQRLRAVRERVNLTQRDVAERLLRNANNGWPGTDIARAAQDLDNTRLKLTDYESGQVVPRADMVYQLAQAIEVEVAELLDPATAYDLEYLRVRRGMRQADVVDAGLGVGRAYYSRVERGMAPLGDEQQRRLAEILDVDPADLAVALSGGHTIGSMSR
ncbi:helix-turn-helix transcriptional regulator [Micromonospora sp. NPDC049662]|uniref:helix-turn-helix domain-containing protein n=1 Tax=Micromonospora sp. NPDC049662 TaxID=3155397 RepID=UPI003448EBB6